MRKRRRETRGHLHLSKSVAGREDLWREPWAEKACRDGSGPHLEGLEYQVQGLGLDFLGSGKALVFSEKTHDKLMGRMPFPDPLSSQCGPFVYPRSASFPTLHGVYCTVCRPPVLSSQLMRVCLLHGNHCYRHLAPSPHPHPQLWWLTCPWIYRNTLLSHREVLNSHLPLIPLPVLWIWSLPVSRKHLPSKSSPLIWSASDSPVKLLFLPSHAAPSPVLFLPAWRA